MSIVLILFACMITFGDEQIDFKLKDIHGRTYILGKDFANKKATVVTFIGTECPLVKLYSKRLNEFAEKYKSKSVEFIGINSNRHDSIEELQAFARRQKISFPILKDPGNEVADLFDAKRTPEVFVLNEKLQVVYRGAIDDQFTYGIQQSKAKNNYLQDVIRAILSNQEIPVGNTEAPGCIIGRQLPTNPNGSVTFHNQISRIFQSKCVSCHRAGELAPFALNDYQEVVGWAGMIEEVVREKRMPPWHADAAHGTFKNDGRLTDHEKELIYQWVKDGAPKGNPEDSPPQLGFPKGWQIGKPDRIIKMRNRPFRVPATGIVEYQYFLVDPDFKEDKWIKAAECRPGTREVVHHIIVGIKGMGEFGRDRGRDNWESEWIAATAPGAPPMILPDGYAKFVPAGSKLIFQMHYTPNGTPQQDVSEIGFIFADPKTIKKRVMTLMSFNERLEIPAGDDNYRISSRMTLNQDAELMTMFPHMHYRGKDFRYDFKVPGGSYETLLSVPNYDFNWQNAYQLANYRMLPKGTRLRCVAHFDNSENNLANPDPTKTVYWGDQTWEEMMIGYFDVAVDVETSR